MNIKTQNGCECGCKYYSGNEVHHNPHCKHYPQSLSEELDNLRSDANHHKNLIEATTKLIYAIQTQNEKEYKKYLNGVMILIDYPNEGL